MVPSLYVHSYALFESECETPIKISESHFPIAGQTWCECNLLSKSCDYDKRDAIAWRFYTSVKLDRSSRDVEAGRRKH